MLNSIGFSNLETTRDLVQGHRCNKMSSVMSKEGKERSLPLWIDTHEVIVQDILYESCNGMRKITQDWKDEESSQNNPS